MLRRALAPIVILVGVFSFIACSSSDSKSNSGENGFLVPDSGGSQPIDVEGLDAGCLEATSHGVLRPSNLMFVVDRSGSMACNLPSDGQSSADCAAYPARRYPDKPSKWELTLAAIEQALVALQSQGDISVGLSIFPLDNTACSIAPTPAVALTSLTNTARGALNTALEARDPYGETPLAGATILTYSYFLDAMRAGLEGENYVVLITDGVETCNTTALGNLLTQDATTALKSLEIRTFAIGVPGSESGRATLSKLAIAGGTVRDSSCTAGPTADQGNCHFDMTESSNFSDDLLAALAAINTVVVGCSLDVPTGNIDLQRVNVSLNGQAIPYDASQSCTTVTTGWQYADNYAHIVLCGEACTTARQPGASVNLVFGCPTVMPGPS